MTSSTHIYIYLITAVISYGFSFFFLFTRKWKKSSIRFNLVSSAILLLTSLILYFSTDPKIKSLFLLLCSPFISLVIIKTTDYVSIKNLGRPYVLRLIHSTEKLPKGSKSSILDHIFSMLTLSLVGGTHVFISIYFQNIP